MSSRAVATPSIPSTSPIPSIRSTSSIPSASRVVGGRSGSSVGDELLALGWEVNAHQYRLVQLAAHFDERLEWIGLGASSAAAWIAASLQIQASTAREWIRVGHALRYLPLIDEAFAAQELSYAKVRILTRWADDENESELLHLARERSAGRLTVAIARFLADDGETDAERDLRLHDERSLTTWTDGDGMTVIRVVLAPSVAKPVVAAVDEMVRRIAATPLDPDVADGGVVPDGDVDAAGVGRATGVGRDADDAAPGRDGAADQPGTDASADACCERTVVAWSPDAAHGRAAETHDVRSTLDEMRRRWQPDAGDGWVFPTLAQQRADAFVALFLGCDVSLTTEVVVHVRGDGLTFDDGTPTTASAVVRQLDDSFIRLLLHDADRRPINASRRQRHPTTRQRRVVLEAHGHECVDCQRTELLELDHQPSWEQTRHTVVEELEPRCAPCHRARHRRDGSGSGDRAA